MLIIPSMTRWNRHRLTMSIRTRIMVEFWTILPKFKICVWINWGFWWKADYYFFNLIFILYWRPSKTFRQAPTESLLCLSPGAHEILGASSQSRVCVSPSPVELLHTRPTARQSQMLWDLLLSQTLRLESLMWGLRILNPVWKPLWDNYFPVCR